MTKESIENQTTSRLSGAQRAGFSELAFTVFIAATVSIIAFSVDIMLPALMDIGNEYQLTDPNDAQLVIVAFIFSLGVSQLFFGPLTDAFGRRLILTLALLSFAITSVAALFAPNFASLLFVRVLAGASAGAARTAAQAIVRDCYSGNDMARVMSNVMAVFMVAPLIAPAIGQYIIYIANWHWIFLFLGAGGFLTYFIAFFRLKETQKIEDRMSLSIAHVVDAFRESLRYRRPVGYCIVAIAFSGALFTYVVTIAQVFGELYGMGSNFIYAFMIAAASMAISSVINGRIVKNTPLRKIVHLSIMAFLAVTVIFFIAANFATVPFALMLFVTIMTMLLFGFVVANTTAIALEPLGHIAGTASSVLNTMSVSFGALIGGVLGQLYDGTVIPMANGYLILGIVSLIAALWAERWTMTLK